jgi:hypothetical protein
VRLRSGEQQSLGSALLFLDPDDALPVIRDQAEEILHIPIPDIHHLVHPPIDTIDATIETMQPSLVQEDTDQPQNRWRGDNNPELELRHDHFFSSILLHAFRLPC